MKNSMKKILIGTLSWVLAITMLFCFAACNNTVDDVKVEKIDIVSLPAVTEYVVGDVFSADGGKIAVTYSDETTKELALSAEGVRIVGADTTVHGMKTVAVVYSGKITTFKINVSRSIEDETPIEVTVTGIEISSLPIVTEYEVGDTFSRTGGAITVKYSNNTSKQVSFSSEEITITGADTNTIGKHAVKVTYGDFDATFEITVTEKHNPEATVTGISIRVLPTKTTYTVGDTFSVSGGAITVTYSDESTKLVELTAAGVTVSEPDMQTVGTQTITVTYEGETTTFDITVEELSLATITKITVSTKPAKTQYFVDETFNPEGGIITVEYSDKTTKQVLLTNSDVTLSSPNMTINGEKTITVTYGGKKTTFTINVSNVGAIVTLDHNYADGPAVQVKVAQFDVFKEPEVSLRNGYTFYKWYYDASCTLEYIFSNIQQTSDITLYAFWKKDGATYYDVTFDLNYYGVAQSRYAQLVESGNEARLIADPARGEHTFAGWYTDAETTVAYSGAISKTTTLYAKWINTKVGSSTYRFEAENADLKGKSGPGFSGEANGANMIVTNPLWGASGNKYVSYLYRNGNSLEFYIASNVEDKNATLKISMAAELPNIDLNPNNYKIKVNGAEQSYSAVSLTEGAKFSEAITITGITLKAGNNLVQLVTNNDVNPAGEGVGTYEATAPMIDYISITTTAVLMWDGTYGLPANT